MRDIREAATPWWRWGPYLSERQWGTVREDYSADGDAWNFFPHDHARSRAYRWGEDGLLGISDNHGYLCFSTALWNTRDPILKERLFGLTGPQGNHGEDVKEQYFYLDNLPSHAWMQALYKYPQPEFPYARLVEENTRRGRSDPEFELLDTGVFAENRYWDLVFTYAKADPEDLLIQIEVTNRGPEAATLHALPTLWFRNTWSWGRESTRPSMRLCAPGLVEARDAELGTYYLAFRDAAAVLFTDNETNMQRLWQTANRTQYVKDAFDRYLLHGEQQAINPEQLGTKAAAHYALTVEPGKTSTLLLRLSKTRHADPWSDAPSLFDRRRTEADDFYRALPGTQALSEDECGVQRQAFAGLLWSKQFYDYQVEEWLEGDPAGPPPPPQRWDGRNSRWQHIHNADVFCMPDTWEYPWYAAWDLAFHCVALARVDCDLAKRQLLLLLREWYMHPNGQLPAYEWAFDDVNPPVHAWAALTVYRTEQRLLGRSDYAFLARVYQKLLLNFTWWINRKDRLGNNVFEGGFLGLDNIGVFDRSKPLPTGGYLEQADGTAWMGMFCLNMFSIAVELARADAAYEDLASKFFQHFLHIAAALNDIGKTSTELWDNEDEFFYDVLHMPDGAEERLKVRSMVGLLPLLAVSVIDVDMLQRLPAVRRRMDWVLMHRPDLASLVAHWHMPGAGDRRLVALVRGHRMKRLLARMLDPAEFLSDFGVRSVSRAHLDHPYEFDYAGQRFQVGYEPAESHSGVFGGNSNWRGPIWFPMNYLLIEALREFHRYYADDFLVEHPTGSGQYSTLAAIADDLGRRVSSIFLRDAEGRRPVYGGTEVLQSEPYWRDHVQFFEYFHGDDGAGLGASHQTGWTALVAPLLLDAGLRRAADHPAH
ncbi:MAG: glucosidase [Chloroflexi bacterium]|nr:glucosidase [Chloroflexota bacterium]